MLADVSTTGADGTGRPEASAPHLDPAATLLFVVNAAAGSSDVDAKRAVIESALVASGRQGELLICKPADLARVATEAAATAVVRRRVLA